LDQLLYFTIYDFIKNCKSVLWPIKPSKPRFTQLIMQRSRRLSAFDELRAVCLLYNIVAYELNLKYGFAFIIVDNVPKPDSSTKYDSLAADEYNEDLAEYFYKP
jgi:hypothetical protein